MGGGTRGVVLPLPLLHPMILLILPLLCSLLERKSMGSRLAFLKLFLSLWFSISRPNHFFTIYWTQSTLKAIDIQTKDDFLACIFQLTSDYSCIWIFINHGSVDNCSRSLRICLTCQENITFHIFDQYGLGSTPDLTSCLTLLWEFSSVFASY